MSLSGLSLVSLSGLSGLPLVSLWSLSLVYFQPRGGHTFARKHREPMGGVYHEMLFKSIGVKDRFL